MTETQKEPNKTRPRIARRFDPISGEYFFEYVGGFGMYLYGGETSEYDTDEHHRLAQEIERIRTWNRWQDWKRLQAEDKLKKTQEAARIREIEQQSKVDRREILNAFDPKARPNRGLGRIRLIEKVGALFAYAAALNLVVITVVSMYADRIPIPNETIGKGLLFLMMLTLVDGACAVASRVAQSREFSMLSHTEQLADMFGIRIEQEGSGRT